MADLSVLLYAIPPAAGAVIGYVTNALAIRMLFRPLRAFYIGRLRIPFTPGIIPRQRERLADSIARMVGRTLLTPETLIAHLHRPSMESAVYARISGYTEMLLHTPIEEHTASEGLSEFVTDVCTSPAFPSLLHDVSGRVVRAAGSLRIGGLLPEYSAAAGSMYDRLADLLQGRRPRVLLRLAARRGIRKLRQLHQPLQSYLPQDTAQRAAEFADAHYDEILERIVRWLQTPGMQRELSRRGRVVLKRILQRLRFMQRFFVSAGQYDRSLDEQMPQIIQDLIGQLEHTARRDDTRALVLREVQLLVAEMLGETPAGLERRFGLDWERLADRGVQAGVHKFLGDAEQVQELLQRAVEWAGKASIGDLLQAATGSSPEELGEHLANMLLRRIGIDPGRETRREDVKQRLQDWRRAAAAPGRTVADYIALQPDQKQGIDQALTGRFFSIAEAKLPGLIDAVDFVSLVRNRVNALDVQQVEELLLMVMQRHLKFINIFGAILGAGIGALQLLLSRLL